MDLTAYVRVSTGKQAEDTRLGQPVNCGLSSPTHATTGTV